ncbi:hypothetical protein [Aminobacter sp. MDW-2]|uniref:hypothetical protein n=1 Tax=Aminobacter sp. MDW-2 TaxID=2666139 RepID=UPI0012AF3973|nr:hypothetical protein [Aminobacter sp. MDW-2]MRX31887.1 hypothetical protein [Aminobacter sp. MDW-2]QNH32363.1 hypothetical protein H5P29_17575 [Aminobacter sp. MDW-2]
MGKLAIMKLITEADGRVSKLELASFKREFRELLVAAYGCRHAGDVPSFQPLAERIIAATSA